MILYEFRVSIGKKTSVMGIEPTTFGLGGRCSTFELHGLGYLQRVYSSLMDYPFETFSKYHLSIISHSLVP